jgi:putative redox protein
MAVEMKVEIRQVSGSASEATLGRHQVTIDRPVAKGGADAGPMGGQLFLASVGGCFMSNLLAAIKARGVVISDVRVEVTGVLAEAPARFEKVELRVEAESADPEMLSHVAEIADRGCIMMNTLRGIASVTVVTPASK